MSTTTCARSGGGALFTALSVQPVASALFHMQADMDRYASGPETQDRIHREEINRAWADHARQLQVRR